MFLYQKCSGGLWEFIRTVTDVFMPSAWFTADVRHHCFQRAPVLISVAFYTRHVPNASLEFHSAYIYMISSYKTQTTMFVLYYAVYAHRISST